MTYSLPNIHGDVYLTVDADGAVKSTHQTGPFGEQLPNQTNPQNTADGTMWNYLGQHEKITDTDTSPIEGGIIQMGARVYIPTLGRFLQVDPVEGGGDNNYVYVNDPVNEDDLDGKIAPLIAFVAWQLGRIAVQQVVKYAVKQAATQAVKQVGKKVVVQSTKKVAQKTIPKKVVQAQNYSRKLADGRINSYGKFRPANKQGEMLGSRKVAQFNPRTGITRKWYETIDRSGTVRQVRPLKGNVKTKHYRFDRNGKYIGSW